MTRSELIDVKNNFISELFLAQQGKKSSLPYIRHTIPDRSLVKDGDVYQVLVFGGTVFRSALCKKENGNVKVITKSREDCPKFLTKEDFLFWIETRIEISVTVVSLNFAYPMEPSFSEGKLDGVLISGTKENTFIGLVGDKVGESISKYIKEKNGREVIVTTANDTICLLLSGLNQYRREELIGGIVGTGLNFAFFDDIDAINLESANFDKFEISAEANAIDQASQHPGRALFEKEVSGAYLFHHYNLKSPTHTLLLPLSSTVALENIAKGSDSSQGLAKEIFDRSAALVACQIAGIVEFKQQNCVAAMEGSLFWKAQGYKTLVEKYVGELTSFTVTFIKIDDESVIGGAMLVG